MDTLYKHKIKCCECGEIFYRMKRTPYVTIPIACGFCRKTIPGICTIDLELISERKIPDLFNSVFFIVVGMLSGFLVFHLLE